MAFVGKGESSDIAEPLADDERSMDVGGPSVLRSLDVSSLARAAIPVCSNRA